MRIQPELSEVTIVLVGSLNPRIFTPDWFARHGLITDQEADAAEVEIVHSQITAFRTDWLNLRVEPERFQAITTEAPYVRLSDIVVRTFNELLSHAPLTKLGINRQVHFDVGSFDARDRIGNLLAPKEPWGEWAPHLIAGDDEKRGGMVGLTMLQKDVDDRKEGYIQARIEPSRRTGLLRSGIYMQVNDHYEAKDPDKVTGADEIIEILSDRFDKSIQRSEWIIDQIMKLK
jgi:hypothetical protein